MTAILAMTAGVLAVAGVVQTAAPAHAESTTLNSASNPFFVYLKAGETLYASSAGLGAVLDQNEAPATPSAPGVYGPATEDGIWQVNSGLVNSAGSMHPWEITARGTDGSDILGRVWSNLFGTNQPLNQAAEDLTYWVVNDTGYQYQVSFDGYHGWQSRIRADAIGNPVVKGECIPSYQSKQSDFQDASWDLIPDCGDPFRIFFAPPAADLPAAAKIGATQIPVLPPPVERADLEIDDLAFASTTTGSADGGFSWSLTPRFVGSYWLDIDADGDGAYDGPADRRIQQYADGSGDYSYAFDGVDGEGADIADCGVMNARIYFDKIGEVHFVQDDVEGRTGGIEVIRLNGPGSPDATVYWDDTKLTGTRTNSTPTLDGTAGVDSTGGLHGWGFETNSWGNDRVIEDWTYTPLDTMAAEIEVSSGCIAITKTSDAAATTRIGDDVTYTVTATNTGSAAYTNANPAVVLDDLSDVLDDATYAADAAASRPGSLSYQEPLISWVGPLGIGESVELTYTVTVTANGDGNLRNVTWVPADPENPTTPSCGAVGGVNIDPITGEPCAVTDTQVPVVTVTKSADPVSGTKVAPGEELTYTLTFVNASAVIGSTDYTDDLSGVLDDAELTGTPVTSVDSLEAIVDESTIRITGTVDAGATVTVSYTVTVKPNSAQGDRMLRNVVFLTGGEPVCDIAALMCTEHPTTPPPVPTTPPANGGLAITGGELSPWLLAMLLLIPLGMGLLGAKRNRRQPAERS